MENKTEAVNPKNVAINEMIKNAEQYKEELKALGYDVDIDGTVTNTKTGRQVFVDKFFAGARNTTRHPNDRERYTRISNGDIDAKEKPFDYKGYLDTDRPNKEKYLPLDNKNGKRHKVNKYKALNFETQPNETSTEYKKYTDYINKKQAEIDALNGEIDLTQSQLDQVKQARTDLKNQYMKKESKSNKEIDVSAYATIVDKLIPVDDEYIDDMSEKVFDEELLLKEEFQGIYTGDRIRIVLERTLENYYSVSMFYFLDSSGYCAGVTDIITRDLEELGGLSGVIREIALGEKRTFEARGGGYATGETPDELGIEFPENKLTEAQTSTFQPAYFAIDYDNAYFKGYHDPRSRWNGWAMPFFTKDVAMEIAKRYSVDTDYEISYDEQKDMFLMKDKNYEDTDDEYIEEIPKYSYATTEGTKDLYPIGAGCWIWDAYTREEMENNGDADYIFESKDPEEHFEINKTNLEDISDMTYKGIWVRYVDETNTLQFILDPDKADELQVEDTIIETMVYRNQTAEEIKQYIDNEIDSVFFTE